MKMNEEATFAVYQKKLKGICEENDLQATFNRSGYPLTMTVRPLQDVADQMSMLEKVEDNGYTSPDASIKFSYEDGAIKYTLSKEFVISDALFTKLKNLFRNLHDTWLQYFHRTVIQKKLLNANVPDIPEDADGFGDIDPDDLIKSGESYMSISKALGKSEKAIRGKVYYCYLTENADKVRAMMAGGNWGDGAPEPTVWQARLLSRSRAEMQTAMTMLVEALTCRIRQVGYNPALEDHWNQYWQRTTCLHWDDLKHCTAGCTDCDSCAEYKKIPPQYCARCGATFYERKENTFCLQCRFDRKKQAQRHWCRVNAKRGERP